MRQRRHAQGVRQADLAALLGVSHQAVPGWERGIRTMLAMLDLALEAREWRALANHDPPEDAARRILLARGADTQRHDLLETEEIVMHRDDAIAEQLQAFNEELVGSGWKVSVTLPGSGRVCLRLERRIEAGWESVPRTLEICRRTFEEAAKSARKHVHTPA